MTKQIRVSDETYKRLNRVGKKGQTYDDIVSCLLDYYENESN
jgi:predicted CopG family antitoxin